MIRFENRYDEYAYRVASRKASEDLKTAGLNEGQWVTLNDDGEVVLASDDNKKAFMAISSKRDGRDNITPTNRVSYLMGHFEVTTDQFDTTGDYSTAMTPLSVDSDSVLVPASEGERVEAYSIGEPSDGFLRVCVIDSYFVPVS